MCGGRGGHRGSELKSHADSDQCYSMHENKVYIYYSDFRDIMYIRYTICILSQMMTMYSPQSVMVSTFAEPKSELVCEKEASSGASIVSVKTDSSNPQVGKWCNHTES